MVARRDTGCQTQDWQRELAAATQEPDELVAALDLDPDLLPGARAAAADFRVMAPRGYLALMEPGNPNDPLTRQILPVQQELEEQPGFCADPVGDGAAVLKAGLLQKYQGRALLLMTSACAVHCRYCFRRRFPYRSATAMRDRRTAALAHLAADPSIREIILSGGDPLMLDDDELNTLIRQLDAIAHLKRLRVHTRLPIVLPSRVTPRLCRTLASSRLAPVVVVHANHARELGEAACLALGRLGRAGIRLLNQSVLLRGVNDRAEDLAALSELLLDNGVLPYYLHLLDKVRGAAHFAVPVASATRIMEELRSSLPGYLVPRLVVEEAGKPCKTRIA